MLELDRIAEQRINEALERGEFDALPGAGLPLELDDDSMVPPELRASYRVLKNNGLAPEPVRARHELLDAIEAECTAEDIDTKRHAVRRFAVLSLQLERQGIGAAELDQYRRQIVERLSQTDRGQHPQSDD